MANKDVLTNMCTAALDEETKKSLRKVSKDCASAIAHDGLIKPVDALRFADILEQNLINRFSQAFKSGNSDFELVPTVVAETLIAFLQERTTKKESLD